METNGKSKLTFMANHELLSEGQQPLYPGSPSAEQLSFVYMCVFICAIYFQVTLAFPTFIKIKKKWKYEW